MGRFRILSIDGGGIRGAFAASVLAELEAATGDLASDHFDLIAGTSTGGIIALGIGLGLTAAQICDFYRDRGPEIFPSVGLLQGLWATFNQLWRPKRSRELLESALQAVFKKTRLGESRCRLVLPAYDAVTGRIFVIKTAHDPRFNGEYRALAVDCALATAAAPTYFRASKFPLHPGVSYIDGGVWANCPVLVGFTEAVKFLGAIPAEIDLLSLGTTSDPFSISQLRRNRGGVLQWNKGLLELLMRGQTEAALSHVSLLAGFVHRIDVKVSAGRFSLDDSSHIDDLFGLGFVEARKKEHLDVVRERFLNGIPAAPFVPVYQIQGPA